MTLRVRISPIFLYEVTVGAGQQPPIEITQVIAGIVLTIFGELSRKAREGRTVQPGHEPFDDGARQQFEGTDTRKNFRIEKARRAGSVGRTSSRLVFDRRCFPVPPHRTNGTHGMYRSYRSHTSYCFYNPL